MANAIRVGMSVLRYRGGPNQWAWAIHRVAGAGILLFLALHIADIFMAAFGPRVFNELLFLYKGPPARVLEILLGFGLLYHALNGLRITAADLMPRLAGIETARRLFYLEITLFVALFAPGSYFMMWTLAQEPFRQNALIATATTVAILALPAVLILGAQGLSSALVPAPDVSDSIYGEAAWEAFAGGVRRPRGRVEVSTWAFMRISGMMLIVLALFHMVWLHFVVGVETITFNTIVERWNDPTHPSLSMFWRGYDLALLALGFTHGTLGANYLVRDYVHGRAWRRVFRAGLVGLWIVLLLMGGGMIFFFSAPLSQVGRLG